ncbi:MAG: hypothetical protein MI746_10910, partial [Pseudomonadales bacterium]|nr:hypothetical protein [Pseudomonadales bacterium]
MACRCCSVIASLGTQSRGKWDSTEPAPVAIQAVESRFPLDWVPREAMTEQQRQAIGDNCCGGFVDPLQE